MNTVLKVLTCGLILTSVAPAAENNDIEAAIAASLLEHQNTQAAAWEREEQLALEISLLSFNEQQIHQEAHFLNNNQQIIYDENIAELLAAQEGTEELDPEIQKALLASTYDAQTAAELEAADLEAAAELEKAMALSLQIEPAQDKIVLIVALETLAAGTLQKNAALKSYFTNSYNLIKMELDKIELMTKGADISLINNEINRLKRIIARNKEAFTQAINSPEQKITFLNLLKVKFPDYIDAQINEILEEIGK